MISIDEYINHARNIKFDMNGNSIDNSFKRQATVNINEVTIPDNFSEMVQIVRKLSKPFPHVRVDLFNIQGKIYFGELTFYSNAGIVNISDKKMDHQIGNWIPLENVKDYLCL